MGLGFWEWSSIILIWFISAAIVVYVDVVVIERRIRKIMEQYQTPEERLALRAKKLPAWLEKIDAELDDTK